MSKEILPDKYRDEDFDHRHDELNGDPGVNDDASEWSHPESPMDYNPDDDASEWSPEPFLDKLGDRPVTLEELVTYLEGQDIIYDARLVPGDGEVTVEELVKRIKAARK